MTMMKSSEVRDRFINYFKKHNHTHIPSSSLIPENDPTLLFANAGMNQFKNLFLGLEKKPYNKAVSVQKCVRAGGKHNDLDNVGFTARHHTFFEMLGNFSFGDYFKEEAIHFAWDFLTNELKIPKDKLYVTVFTTDDQAADIWHKQEGVPKDRIFRLGEKDNFWRMGDVGPCGPSSEIFYDHGPQYGKISDPFKSIVAGEDRYIEIWNLVFMQFYESAPGQQTPLPKPSVDTGAGFERLVAAVQGCHNNYKTDIFSAILNTGAELLNIQIENSPLETLSSLRVLADHCRSVSFLLADGALPANEGRGYVLRRIIRRAIRYGRKLSSTTSLLTPMSEVLIEQMGSFYPELKLRKNHILSTIKDEEHRFLQTLDHGTLILQDEIKKTKIMGQETLSGEVVFKLYDTYGFPADLTALMAAEEGLQIDEPSFTKLMQLAKEKAKSSSSLHWKGKGPQAEEKHIIELTQKFSKTPTHFMGYEHLNVSARVLNVSNGSREVNSLSAGQTGILILQQTPFYAEGGGQVGDQGQMKISMGAATTTEVRVLNCIKINDIYFHYIEVVSGEIKVSDTVNCIVSSSERRQITAHHSATHLLHAALRKVLGDSITQAGSLVDSTKTRFDFTHGKPLSAEEISQVESLVNGEISGAQPVISEVMSHKEAVAKGAVALFGEKYGDQVRVLTMGSFSCELCGGTHVKNTTEIRIFKIISESGVSAGVRRIEALAGEAAIQYLMANTQELLSAKQAAGLEERSSNEKTLSHWIDEKKEEIKDLQKQLKKVQAGQIDLQSLLKSAQEFQTLAGPAQFVFADLTIEDREVLAQITDQIKNKIPRGIILIVGKGETSHPVIISVSKELNSQFKAGDLLKDFAQVLGGKGGGRPDFAQGAVPDRSKLKEAIDLVKRQLTQSSIPN